MERKHAELSKQLMRSRLYDLSDAELLQLRAADVLTRLKWMSQAKLTVTGPDLAEGIDDELERRGGAVMEQEKKRFAGEMRELPLGNPNWTSLSSEWTMQHLASSGASLALYLLEHDYERLGPYAARKQPAFQARLKQWHLLQLPWALRGVNDTVLRRYAREGLPGELNVGPESEALLVAELKRRWPSGNF